MPDFKQSRCQRRLLSREKQIQAALSVPRLPLRISKISHNDKLWLANLLFVCVCAAAARFVSDWNQMTSITVRSCLNFSSISMRSSSSSTCDYCCSETCEIENLVMAINPKAGIRTNWLLIGAEQEIECSYNQLADDFSEWMDVIARCFIRNCIEIDTDRCANFLQWLWRSETD